MQSTVNYLWHTDDLLGQGATASVYKARNKVGPRPGRPHPGPCSPLTPRRFLARAAPSRRQAGMWLGWGDTVGSSRGVGSQKGPHRLVLLSGTVWGWRERGRDTQPAAGGQPQIRNSRGGKQARPRRPSCLPGPS